jgi:murein DD-endopeptidase MepM/ murein hydrolase activator NlpD
LIASLALLWWSWLPGKAAVLPQVVQPGDVATPTATFTIILMPTATPTPLAAPTPVSETTEVTSAAGESLMEPAGLHGPATFSSYTVRPGDTILSVALDVGIDVSDMPCAVAATFKSSEPLVIGNVLEIPPSTWHCHQVEAGESLTEIAAHYGVEPDAIVSVAWNQLDANSLADKALTTGSYVRIPPASGSSESGGFLTFMLDQPLSVSPMMAYAVGGSKPKNTGMIGPIPKDWPYGSGNFMWPVYGWLSQGYREDHRAIDVAAPAGTFVTASDRGVVIRAGWNDQGYGNFIIIDHKIDYLTLYAHLSDIMVKVGDVVAQGQVIGAVGSTGNSTGPHLHFEIRDFGRRINPLDLLVH